MSKRRGRKSRTNYAKIHQYLSFNPPRLVRSRKNTDQSRDSDSRSKSSEQIFHKKKEKKEFWKWGGGTEEEGERKKVRWIPEEEPFEEGVSLDPGEEEGLSGGVGSRVIEHLQLPLDHLHLPRRHLSSNTNNTSMTENNNSLSAATAVLR